MVPVLDRPVMEHILDLLARHGFEEVIANLHYFPQTIRDYFGSASPTKRSPSCSARPAGCAAAQSSSATRPSW